MKTSILAVLLLLSFYLQGQVLSPISPDKRFELILGGEDIGDLNSKFTSYLLDKEEGDTLQLGINLRHDFPPPNWFWDEEANYLILETSEYGGHSLISIWDLAQKKVSHQIKGVIPVRRAAAGQFWDSKREILFFYDLGNGVKRLPKLMDFQLKTKQIQLVHEFSHPFDIESPLVKINHIERTIIAEGKTILY